ncbi:M3 family metallopeptidase [Algoriphagus namhaensis]|uniref:M3 family metallopeptidase n=1 Tax=Algoriphagus namhaensis TaxID=915353 RepID=A0ABV8AV45_9BACT
MTNPLLEPFQTPYDTAPFNQIKPEHFLSAVKKGVEAAQKEIEEIKTQSQSTFENTIEALDRAGQALNRVSSIFFNLNSAETNDQIQSLAREIAPILTEHSNNILLDQDLFIKVKQVFEQMENLELSPEQKTLLEKTYKSFVRNGAKLSKAEGEKLRGIDQKLAQLSLKFGENVLEETNRFLHLEKDESALDGLPESIKEAAAQIAEDKGHPGAWGFTLDYPSYIPAMTYAKNRELRKTLFMASGTKACKGDELDNRQIIKDIIKLRHERASLLGYSSHAAFVLEERMAKSPEAVQDFLRKLVKKAKPKAHLELEELSAFAKALDGIDKIEKWDFAYYSELLKREKYALDDELLRPYFKLENVVQGVFDTSSKLYGLTFKENKEIPTYHPDVKVYEVFDRNNEFVSIFYTDFFPRAGKRNGAWMTSFKGQWRDGELNDRPHVSIVCNFTKPTKTKPSLLTFNEVTTLFHEFGHALHGMLANGTYQSLSGTSVYWDFVELPSQIFENWCYEKECLDLFAKHYETGEKIPEELIEKIKNSANYQQGYQTLRQVSFGLLDMGFHGQEPSEDLDVERFEKSVMAETDLLPRVEGTMMSTAFSHIFQGGYAAGYYSYKWAEVLDADAFELFQEKGIFDAETAEAFANHVLSAGGTEHPSVLYARFRGRDPKEDALLKRAGLIEQN